MIAQAQLKRWSGISVRGDAAFLRDATRLAFAAGIEIAGRDDDMDRVVQAELKRLRAGQPAVKATENDAEPEAAAVADASDGANLPVSDKVAAEVDTEQTTPWFEEDPDWDCFFAKIKWKVAPEAEAEAEAESEAEAEAEAEEPPITDFVDVNLDDDALQDDAPEDDLPGP